MQIKTIRKVTLCKQDIINLLVCANLASHHDDEIQITIDDSWNNVPAEWSRKECPTEYDKDTMLDVKLRDGTEDTIPADFKIGWVHRNKPDDIIAYRINEKKSHDEHLLDQLYWEFNQNRSKRGDEMMCFKSAMRFYANQYTNMSKVK